MFIKFEPKSFPSNLIQKDWTKRKVFHRYGTQAFFDKLHDLEVREDDAWIVTLPKCGTTWMQEMVWLLLNDCNFEQALSEPLELRSPFVEFELMLGGDVDAHFEDLAKMKSPRLIKTHLSLPFLPKQLWTKKPKLIYVFRNPKDALVSAYYFRQSFGTCVDKTIAEAIEFELAEEKRTGSLWNHVLEFYELRNEPWIHYTSFELMKEDLRTELRKVCQFLNININEEMVGKMLKHLSFEEMKNNPQCSHQNEIEKIRKMHGDTDYTFKDIRFMRKGQVGSHKEDLSTELIARLDEWIDESLKPHKLTLNDLLLL